MKMNLIPYLPLMALLLAPMPSLDLLGQETGGKPPERGDRGPMGTRPDQVKAAIEELLAE